MNTLSFTVKSNVAGASKAVFFAQHLSSGIIAGTVSIFQLVLSIIMVALSISSASIAACMIGGINPYRLIPSMPYWCGAVFAFALIALSFASALGCRNLIILFRRYMMSRTIEVSKPFTMSKFTAKKSHRRKKVVLVSLAVFAVYFVSAFAVSSITAGTMGFWHQWNWFVR